MGDVSCDILWGAWSRPFLALQPIKPKPAVLHAVPPGRNSWDVGRFRGGDRCLRAFFDSIPRVVFAFVLSMSCGFSLLFLLLFNIFSFFYAYFSVPLHCTGLVVCWFFFPSQKSVTNRSCPVSPQPPKIPQILYSYSQDRPFFVQLQCTYRPYF